MIIEYSDDKAIVPRSTSVIARRLPPSRPGRGNAQNYMASTLSAPGPSGTGPNAGRKGNMTQRFDVRNDAPTKASVSTDSFTHLAAREEKSANSARNTQNQTPTPQPIIEATASTDADEASKIAAMFANTDEQWKTTQEKMSTSVFNFLFPIVVYFACQQRMYSDSLCPLFRSDHSATYYGFRGPRTGAPGGSKPPQHAAPDKPVPAGYVCYRCGQPGWSLFLPSIPQGCTCLTFSSVQAIGYRTVRRTAILITATSLASRERQASRRASCRPSKVPLQMARIKQV